MYGREPSSGKASGATILATILTTDYYYNVIDLDVDFILLNQKMRYIVDVEDDLAEIMHVYPSMEYVRYQVSQSPEGILIELI